MAPEAVPTPKFYRLRKGMVGTTLPPGALMLVDSLVGTFLGSTRSELLRFIVIEWLVTHHLEVKEIAESKKAPKVKQA